MPNIGGARPKLNKNIKRKTMYVTKPYYQAPGGKKHYYEAGDNVSRIDAYNKAIKELQNEPQKLKKNKMTHAQRKHAILFGKK